MVARAAGDKFASQPGIFVHLQHVNAGVRHAAANKFIQRCFPACRGLVRQAGDQVHIDVADPCPAQPRHIGQSNVARVQATNGARFGIHERLHAQVDPIHAAARQRIYHGVAQCARGAFHRDFAIVGNIESFANRRENRLQLRRLQQTRRAAAEINGINFALEFAASLDGDGFCRSNIGAKPVHIALHPPAGKNIRGKVAVTAFGFAERHRDVQAQRHHPILAVAL